MEAMGYEIVQDDHGVKLIISLHNVAGLLVRG
jgi:hypothetical protein